MPLIGMDEVLDQAQEKKYAVGAFNVISMDSLQAIADAAVEAQAPVFLAVCEGHFDYFHFEPLSHLVRKIAESLPVPAVMHLDHGFTFETVRKAVQLGYTSVMFDGSAMPFEQNIADTKKVVDVCHAAGIHVEAELGNIGGAEGAIALTDPDKAVEFVERTKCDTLAVAIGTAHGVYKGKPNLDFERLEMIRERVAIPLVLHGGTGLPDEDIRRCIAIGICKLNVYTQLNLWATQAARARLSANPDFTDFPLLLLDTQAAMKAGVIRCMDLFGCAGTANSCKEPATRRAQLATNSL